MVVTGNYSSNKNCFHSDFVKVTPKGQPRSTGNDHVTVTGWGKNCARENIRTQIHGTKNPKKINSCKLVLYKETKQNYNSAKKRKEKNRRDKEKQALPRIDLSHVPYCFSPRVF